MVRTRLVVISIAVLSFTLARAQTTTIISVDSNGNQGNEYSSALPQGLSGDGRYVVFNSGANDLVLGDANFTGDVFVRDSLTNATTCLSVDSNGIAGNSFSGGGSISADGRYVAFMSFASNLVAGDSNGFVDVFVRDRQNGTTEIVSVASDGTQGNANSGLNPGTGDAVLCISGDGRYVAFTSYAHNLVPGDTNGVADVFVHDRQSGLTTRASVDSSGAQASANSVGFAVSLSADGRYVAFDSDAGNLVPFGAPASNAYVHDMQTGITILVTLIGTTPIGDLSGPSISADGRFVAFESLGGGVYVRDRESGTTILVSVNSGGTGGGGGTSPTISADGRFVVFASAGNLVPWDTNTTQDIFVHGVQSGITTRVSLAASGAQGNAASFGAASISADGRFVAFSSGSTNLVPGDTNGYISVFLRDQGVNVPVPFCFGDGSVAFCPCANFGGYLHGCENSGATGGAVLTASGSSSLSADTLVLTSSSELPNALSIFLQGNAVAAPVAFGDGLRCAGGTLVRLYAKHASAGVASAPGSADATVSSASAALGDPIPTGAARFYQTYYRDSSLVFCPSPGSTFNVSSAVAAYWGP